MTNHSLFLSQKRFHALDGLRALSIVAVIWHHTKPQGVGLSMASMGNLGVDLFFAISGFLITTLLLRERARNGEINLRAFYWRRVVRIFPLYYGVLLLYTIVVAIVERNTAAGHGFFENLVYFITYTSNIYIPRDGRVIFYYSWSLAVEEQFYLIWPLLLYVAGTSSRACVPLTLTVMACVAGQVLDNKFLSAVPLALVAGTLLAVLLHSKKGFDALNFVIGNNWFALVAMGALITSMAFAGLPGFVMQMLITCAVGSCVIRNNSPMAALLSIRPVAYIGSISYGMYMFHMLCKNMTVKMLGKLDVPVDGVQVFIITCLAAVLVASLSFKYYESYFLKLKNSSSS